MKATGADSSAPTLAECESSTDQPTAAASGPSPNPLYGVLSGRICRREDQSWKHLCNFDARIVEDVIYDDGAEQSRKYAIEGRTVDGVDLPRVYVDSARFSGMTWIQDTWGVKAILTAGHSIRDQLREAIQCLSTQVQLRRVYSHAGWCRVDGVWRYLTTGGAVGDPTVEVQLPPDLAPIRLPTVPQEVKTAVLASLAFLDVAPLPVTAPILGAVYRTPLCEFLPCDTSVFLEGLTGTFKSSLAALAQSHWGRYIHTGLPGSWSSTDNHLERRAFTLKDVMFVIDDYAVNQHNRKELEAKASRVLRAQGNRSGRGRLRADGTECPALPPRGVILATGEQRPSVGRSITARMLVVELNRTDVDVGRLTAAQEAAERLPHAMAGYVGWLADKADSLTVDLENRFEALRTKAADLGKGHPRLPSNIAHFFLGLEMLLDYAVDVKAKSAATADDLRHRVWVALMAQGAAMARLVTEEKPVQQYLETLATLVAEHKAELRDKTQGVVHAPDAVDIGWKDDAYVYLKPRPAFEATRAAAWKAGEPLALSESEMRRELAREGLLVSDQDHLTRNVRLAGKQQRVLQLRRETIRELLGHDLLD